MKIIDEKGRLFGKINIIDFLVILFLISLTPMFYYGYKIFNAPPPPPPPPPQIIQEWITVKVKFNGLIPEIVTLLNKGDYEGIIKDDVQKEGQSEDVNSETKEGITAIVKDNPIVESQKSLSFYDYKEYRWLPYPSNQKDVTLFLKILCTKKDDGLLYYKNNPVKVGVSFSFQTKEYDINGTIIGIENKKQ